MTTPDCTSSPGRPLLPPVRTRWAVRGVLAGLVAGASAWPWWPPLPERPAPERPALVWVPSSALVGDAALAEFARFFDSSVLLLPLAGVEGDIAQAAPLTRPDLYGDFPPRLSAAGDALAPSQDTPALPGNALAVLDASPAPLLRWLGAAPAPAAPPPGPERLRLEVFAWPGGEPAAAAALELPPPAPPAVELAPVEFTVVVGPDGVRGRPFLLRGSGLPEWDARLAELARDSALPAALPPGTYRLVLSP